MTATKDIHDRPVSQQALPPRQHGHSLSAGSYRVNRRKSSSSMTGTSLAALAVVAKEASGDHRSQARPFSQGMIPSEHSGLYKNHSGPANAADQFRELHGADHGRECSSAVVDDSPLSSIMGSDRGAGNKSRMRRASEGTRLTRAERRRSTAGELRCDHCGKSYKHGSCLTKHLWEHRPEWNLTSKLLISKHQQVQLLEAASVLMSMNHEGPSIPEHAIQGESDNSSESPAFSGSSDLRDDDQSSRTSSPSQQEETGFDKAVPYRQAPVRQDSYGSTLSRSYQSNSGASIAASSFPNDTGDLRLFNPSTPSRRPSAASQMENEDNPEIVAAAQGLLSCSLGTPSHGPTKLPPDVPPVPPLPEKFAKQASRPVSLPQTIPTDVGMEGGRPGAGLVRADDDDDEVFGRMEQ